MSGTDVVKFYENKNVLITGASGFLGKVLLWKLIESCPNSTGKIYVLIRSKNSCGADKRLIQMLKAKPFSPKYSYAELLNKVVAIEGDVTAPGLGLSQTDRQLLCEQVNIVFHSAASVRFDAPLKDNMRDNVYGTREIVHLCNDIKSLDSYVHVSTAYSNCHLKDIREDLIPLKLEVDEAIKMIESLPEDANESRTDQLLEGRPNTYTYTKAMAEHLVSENEGHFPIAIVRPSIVISAHEEPQPGWVDNVNGIAGLGCLAAIGLLRTIDWNYFATSDMVPVDYVANCLICAGYQVRTQSPDKIVYYNMTSGNMSPISWGKFFHKLRTQAQARPSTKIVRPMIKPPKWNRANPIGFVVTKFLSELLFAYLIDTIITLLGYKKIMVKITQKMHHGYKILKPFTVNQWNFYSDNVISLSDSLAPKEREMFKFDMRHFDWNEQARVTWNGARLHLLKEESTEESYRIGRGRQSIVTFVHYAGIAMFMGSLAFLGYAGVSLLRSF